MIREETLRHLEFDKILMHVAGFAHSSVSHDDIVAIRPLHERAAMERRLALVEEIRLMAQGRTPLRLDPFADIRPLLVAVRPEGALIDTGDLADLTPVLDVMGGVARQVTYRSDTPELVAAFAELRGFPTLLEILRRTLDSEGHILDSASPELARLRSAKRSLTERIRRTIEEIIRARNITPFLQDDFITQRSGRWVIPVRMDSKGMVGGVVHDVSNSGETAFMEPLEIIPLSNELENLVAEEKGEEIRIIRGICRRIRELAPEIDRQFVLLVELDVLNAIAVFAEEVRGTRPNLSEEASFHLAGGRHPLLLLSHLEGGGREPVPLDLRLGKQEGAPIIVITGPNAGGKTIALKTAGLLLLMALSGMPIPAEGHSTLPVVSDLLVDIGDEQSIEASLSTFAAHAANLAEILQRADARSLVLIDELGTGTEPLQGAALSCGILNELSERGSLVVTTTHLTDIVGFVHSTGGMMNASMDFDGATFTPLYRLKVGEPGQSHALEIARKYGLPEKVIAFAREKLGTMEADFHNLMAELKERSLAYDRLIDDLEKRESDLEARERKAAARSAEAEARVTEAMRRASDEARELLRGARRDLNAILDEARREKNKESRKKLETVEKTLETNLSPPEPVVSPDEIREGDTVFVVSLGYDAVVVAADRHDRIRVRAGNMEFDVPSTGLRVKRGKGVKVVSAPPKRKQAEEEDAATSLHLLGYRVDEAIQRLETFLNHAALSGVREVRVVHGIGTGALMKGIRDHLEGHPLVQEYRVGEAYEGGKGATIVTLR